MNTPREILLEQNRHHDSRLEEIQRKVIAHPVAQVSKPAVSQASKPAGVQTPNKPSILTALWLDLILPARRIWLAYAFIWLALAAFYITTSDPTPTQIAKTSNSSEAIANWKEQQIIIAELTKPISHDPVDRPKPHPMRPRSEAYTIAIG